MPGVISLVNLQKNLEREKYLREEILQLRHNDEIVNENSKLMKCNKRRIHRLKRARKAIMRQREEYVREYINKDVICVNAAHLEAVCFLKREGWTGKALIHQEEFAGELSKNNISFILEVSSERDT